MQAPPPPAPPGLPTVTVTAKPITKVYVGRAQMRCTTTPEGTLTDCRVLSEEPAGSLAVSNMALKMTPHLRVKPPLRDGQPVAGRITFNVKVMRDSDATLSDLEGRSPPSW